jgi:hypothetical protein
MYIEELRELVPPPDQNSVGVCNQITLRMLYYIISSLVTLLKVTDALYKSYIVYIIYIGLVGMP